VLIPKGIFTRYVGDAIVAGGLPRAGNTDEALALVEVTYES
jgi:hypothetical protein